FPALSCDEGKQRDAENESRSSPKKQKETKLQTPALENRDGSGTRKFKGWPNRVMKHQGIGMVAYSLDEGMRVFEQGFDQAGD
ncbi:MAG TPA: hypothetical protein VNI36_08510, partial [Candidatus Dormibacteraeota bacterium]|nr:hypothetical protein [Candidatus Dormibacteraeota bacterium]